jgi:hypothetical protein
MSCAQRSRKCEKHELDCVTSDRHPEVLGAPFARRASKGGGPGMGLRRILRGPRIRKIWAQGKT